MSNTNDNVTILEKSIDNLESNNFTIYFLTYDTKKNPRASVKYIYDLAKTLKNNNYKVKILVEDKNYSGVNHWLGERYSDIEVLSIKDDKVELKIEDVLVVPEYYSNVLEQLMNVKSVKVILVQQKDYIYETLPIGSKWIDYGFDKVITTGENAKKYILEYFPESIVYTIPPIVENIFKKSEHPLKPYIAISCRDRAVNKKIISEFYLKYPQLRWITFKDMVQLSYDEFAENLKECLVSVWVDNESTFGTFPIESMKCGIPVIGKIPEMEPDWLSENGLWTYDVNKICELLGTYILAWLDGVEISDEIKNKVNETLSSYDIETIETNIVSIFKSFVNKRYENIKAALEKIKQEVNV